MPDLVNVPAVELLRVGHWNPSVGPKGGFDVTPDMLQSIIAAAGDPNIRTPILKLGHKTGDGDHDAWPAVGRVTNLRLSATDSDLMIGDFVGVPRKFAEMLPTTHPSRSVELALNLTTPHGTHKAALTAVALLGETPPAIESLADIQAIFDQPAIAASQASTRTVLVFMASGPSTSTDPANPGQEGAHMDPKKLRASLGLAEDAPDEQVDERIAALAAADETARKAAEELLVRDRELADLKAKTEPAAPSAPVVPDGMALVDQTVLDGLKVAAAKGEQAYVTLQTRTRDELLDGAVKDGKFAPARKAHFSALYDADPDGTSALIATLASGTIPVVDEAGHSDSRDEQPDDELWAEITSHLNLGSDA